MCVCLSAAMSVRAIRKKITTNRHLLTCSTTRRPPLLRGRLQGIRTIVKMHQAGVTHNDIKPHNIVVKDKGDPAFAEVMGTRYEMTFVDLGCALFHKVS